MLQKLFTCCFILLIAINQSLVRATDSDERQLDRTKLTCLVNKLIIDKEANEQALVTIKQLNDAEISKLVADFTKLSRTLAVKKPGRSAVDTCLGVGAGIFIAAALYGAGRLAAG